MKCIIILYIFRFYGVHPFKISNSGGNIKFNDNIKVPQSLKNLII